MFVRRSSHSNLTLILRPAKSSCNNFMLSHRTTSVLKRPNLKENKQQKHMLISILFNTTLPKIVKLKKEINLHLQVKGLKLLLLFML